MKCLDCGYNISADEIDEHEGHEVIEGFFEDKITTAFIEKEMLEVLREDIEKEMLRLNK